MLKIVLSVLIGIWSSHALGFACEGVFSNPTIISKYKPYADQYFHQIESHVDPANVSFDVSGQIESDLQTALNILAIRTDELLKNYEIELKKVRKAAIEDNEIKFKEKIMSVDFYSDLQLNDGIFRFSKNLERLKHFLKSSLQAKRINYLDYQYSWMAISFFYSFKSDFLMTKIPERFNYESPIFLNFKTRVEKVYLRIFNLGLFEAFAMPFMKFEPIGDLPRSKEKMSQQLGLSRGWAMLAVPGELPSIEEMNELIANDIIPESILSNSNSYDEVFGSPFEIARHDNGFATSSESHANDLINSSVALSLSDKQKLRVWKKSFYQRFKAWADTQSNAKVLQALLYYEIHEEIGVLFHPDSLVAGLNRLLAYKVIRDRLTYKLFKIEDSIIVAEAQNLISFLNLEKSEAPNLGSINLRQSIFSF